MRINTNDLTLKRNYLNKYRFLIKEYEQVKKREHPTFRFAKDFYGAHDTDARSFLKCYIDSSSQVTSWICYQPSLARHAVHGDLVYRMSIRYWNYGGEAVISLK
jgi:hypothetical protein